MPQTGLGILMNGSSNPTTTTVPTLLAPHPPTYQYTSLAHDQQTRIQEDLADRERQASALAAAGMVAESINYTKPSVIGQVLQAPPPLVGMPPPSHPPAVEDGHSVMEGINWNDLGGVDDIDMDFAAMFDPEQEQAFMQEASFQLDASSNSPSAMKTEEHGTPNPLTST